jgi:NADH:ubiquinone oxidoreductase subunit 2 (subunit N)
LTAVLAIYLLSLSGQSSFSFVALGQSKDTLAAIRAYPLLLIAIVALAGLPPFIFFFFKVSLLLSLIASGGFSFCAVLLCLILLGWFMYFSILQAQAALE